MKKICIIITTLLLISLYGCSGTKEVDISKYIEITTSGYQDYGKISASLNSDIYKDKEIFGESQLDYSSLDSYNIKIIADKEKNLKNDDIVNLSLEYDEDFYKKDLKVKLVNKDKKEYKVSGLNKAFMTQKDITNDNYIKFKDETYDKVKKYVDSTNKSNTTYGDIEFIDAFIKNPINKIEDDQFTVPSLVYLYKVNKTVKYEYSKPDDTINYIFVSIEGITLDNEGMLSGYVVKDIDGGLFSENIKSYKSDKLPDLESVKADYMNTNDVLEKLNISQ